MVGLDKQVIRERLRNRSTWVTTARTALFAAAVTEWKQRFLIAVWISGNVQQSLDIMFEKLKEDGTYETLWSPIPIAPSDLRQLPDGEYDLEDPLTSFEGGTNFYGKAGGAEGVSVNVSIAYWDSEL